MDKKERLGMIDVYRLISVFVIFLFHSNIHIGCDYSFLTPFINMGAIFMTVFFLISGFSLYYVSYESNDFCHLKNILAFYKKRIISIMPMYWFMVITYPIWDILINKNSIMNNLILMPIEFLGLQNVFHSLFGYTHNGGTWFVSCILFCYLVFPFVFDVIKEMNIRAKVISGMILVSILLYSPFLAEYLEVENIYSNLFFRILEFIIGMLLCSIWFEVREKSWYRKFFANWIVFCSVLLILIAAVTFLVDRNFQVGNYMIYSIIGLPCFSLLVFSGGGDTSRINSSKLIKYMVDISYVFFFAQFYTWKITLAIIKLTGMDNNFIRIVLSLTVCTIIAIIMHELIEKPLRSTFTKRINI